MALNINGVMASWENQQCGENIMKISAEIMKRKEAKA
jgi:hypothetical protein